MSLPTAQHAAPLSISMEDCSEDEPTIKSTVHLHWTEYGGFTLSTCKDLGHPFVYVKPVEVEVPVPVNFDPRAAKLASLKEEEQRVRAEFQARITELQRQQSELLALEMA